ncbi:MAG: hypothetical protein Tp1123DCM1511741_51 [Prokaryotic dsDNA virus sp.]|nr:MAG: hypothetical protein Tp1123DCM1511741_51 [Prokaryotic dsDNA virus sp.]|tara:strand:- start:1641 stop:2072 length:432 start_codon:yes stop_codon:yes gene_type:complete
MGLKVKFQSKLKAKTAMAETQFMMNSALFLNNICNSFRNEILMGMNKSTGGITRQLYNPRRVHTASVKGNPPAIDTGRLANSISIKRAFPSVTPKGEVYTKVEYAVPLEKDMKRYFMGKESQAWKNTKLKMKSQYRKIKISRG